MTDINEPTHSTSPARGDHTHTGGVLRLAARSTLIAGALAAAAIAAPVTIARANLDPTPTAQSPTTVAAPAVRPNCNADIERRTGVPTEPTWSACWWGLPEVHRQQAPAAQVFNDKPTQSAPYSGGLRGSLSSPTSGVPAVVHSTTDGNPFDWGDAAIGAGGVLAISLLIAGGAVVVTQRRQPKRGSQNALAG